jgi:hypothetical protein
MEMEKCPPPTYWLIRSWGMVLGLAVLAIFGCQPADEVEHYQMEKVVAAPPRHARGKPTTRMLAALFTRGDTTWVFKVSGPIRDMDKHKGEFERFINSLRFADDEKAPVEWKVPEGWQEQKAGGQATGAIRRFATLRLGPRNAPLELTVFAFQGPEAGDVQANVNRWRGQLGLPPAGEAELARIAQPTEVHGVRGTVVDLAGFGSGKTGMQPPFARGNPHGPAQRPAVKYKTPAGWVEVDPGRIRAAAFVIRAGDEEAEVTVTPLPELGGQLVRVINLWRQEIGLKPLPDSQVRKDVKRIEMAGVAAPYADLVGPAGQKPRRRTLAVVLDRDDLTWFVMLKGPADLVARQKSAFEGFVKSLRFAEAKGADHE